MGIRVLLADDHQIFREGLRSILEENGWVVVVGEAENGLEAVELARQMRPDVVVMDVGMALANGIGATRQIVSKRLARVVVLSMYDDEETVTEAIQAGASGYVPKQSAGQELIDAIEAVQRGDLFLSRALPRRLRDALRAAKGRAVRPTGRLAALTARQRQVMQLLAEGHTNKEMAHHLDIAVETVKSHRKNLKRALGFKTTAEVIRWAVEQGVVRKPTRRTATDRPRAD